MIWTVETALGKIWPDYEQLRSALFEQTLREALQAAYDAGREEGRRYHLDEDYVSRQLEVFR